MFIMITLEMIFEYALMMLLMMYIALKMIFKVNLLLLFTVKSHRINLNVSRKKRVREILLGN